MRRIILESPYRGDNRPERIKNKIYLQECIVDALSRNESPFASHQMFTDAINEDVPDQRSWGIHAGYEWWDAAEAIVFYVDRGWSTGMKWAKVRAEAKGRVIEERSIR